MKIGFVCVCLSLCALYGYIKQQIIESAYEEEEEEERGRKKKSVFYLCVLH